MTQRATPVRYYSALQSNPALVNRVDTLANKQDGTFGLHIKLHLHRRVSLVTAMKPLLDGVICAFHKEENVQSIVDSFRLASDAPFPQQGLDERFYTLGTKDYLHLYRHGCSCKWNPGDNRCRFAVISVDYFFGAPSFDGTLFEIPD